MRFEIVTRRLPLKPPPPSGVLGPLDEISPEQRQFIQAEIEKNRQRLVAEGAFRPNRKLCLAASGSAQLERAGLSQFHEQFPRVLLNQIFQLKR